MPEEVQQLWVECGREMQSMNFLMVITGWKAKGRDFSPKLSFPLYTNPNLFTSFSHSPNTETVYMG
jgi:hypothetical protein